MRMLSLISPHVFMSRVSLFDTCTDDGSSARIWMDGWMRISRFADAAVAARPIAPF